MIKKIFKRIKQLFCRCKRTHKTSRTVKYCSDCKVVLDES